MPLTAEDAVDVAKRHGLSLADAASLRALCDDPESADKIAGRFAAEAADPIREFSRAMFARAKED